ncbi:MAG TPA: DsbA family protein [Verrucomicrobiae bacterium]|nr:DsbA family protein [Verrucomicrobiae bacterium]
MSKKPTSDDKKTLSKRSNSSKPIVLVICAILISIIFVGFFFHGFPAPNLGSQSSSSDQSLKTASDIPLADAKIKGNSSALVTFVDFSDFGCPFCQRYATTTLPQLMKDYVDTNKIRYAFMQFPLDEHPNAKSAAMASECANDQGKFWQYHNTLFSTQSQWKSLSANDASTDFKKYAVDLGLNPSKFDSCLDSKKYENKINHDIQIGTTYVTGTPTFYIGNNKNGYTEIDGSQPPSTFQQTIDHLLKI